MYNVGVAFLKNYERLSKSNNDYIFMECEKEYEKFPGLYKNPKWFFHVGYFFFEFAIDIVDVFELLTCEDSPLFGEEYQNIIREWNSHNTLKIGSIVKFYNQVYILRYDAFEEITDKFDYSMVDFSKSGLDIDEKGIINNFDNFFI